MQKMQAATLIAFGILFGFTRTAAADYVFTAIHVPGSLGTGASGINNCGQFVGTYYADQTNQGFLYTSGAFTTINVPSALCGPNCSTYLAAINGGGQIVGNAKDALDDPWQAFIYNAGQISLIKVPGSSSTFAHGINDRGQIVGYYSTQTSGAGFLDTAGVFTIIQVPGAFWTQAYGVNNEGQIVGTYSNSFGSEQHGFLYTAGHFTTFDGPGFNTIASAINDRGQIVGYAGMVPFLYADGSVTAIDIPRASPFGDNEALGINDRGQITGTYDNEQTAEMLGFLATPSTAVPEPCSWPLIAGFLMVCATILRRRAAAHTASSSIELSGPHPG